MDEKITSLYIHVPFCERKCPYCAFDSALPRAGDAERYLSALARELGCLSRRTGRPRLATCYVGGGTPTVLDAAEWRRLWEAVESCFDFDGGAEVTVEANPNSLKAEHLAVWRDTRVTRVSIGVQSFDDAELKLLGRLHDSAQARRALSAAVAAGFSVSADFMFGLPGQTLKNWSRTLHEAARSGIKHISLYQLTLEPGTPWGNMPEDRLSDGYAPYRWAQWYLPRRGFVQYEVANFAKPGCESRHNINYWREGSYVGAGPGASGFIGGVRYKNVSALDEYARRVNENTLPVFSQESGEDVERFREAAVLALRMNEGIDVDDYVRKYGEEAKNTIVSILSGFPKGFCAISDGRIALTPRGMRVANRIWSELV